MSRPKNRPWVPRLRFPEFRDAGAWEAKEIQECLEYERPDRFIVNSDNYHQSGTPVLTANQSFILGYTNEHDGICNHLPAVIFDDFTTDMKYVDFPFKVKSSAIKILRTKEDNNLSFLYELIYRMPFDASQHKRHYISEYQHQVIRLPHPREQNKIAACLSSLDALITTLSRKIDTLKEHKKGLMQQLFPQEGETVPQLRFPEFRDAGAWGEKRLDQVCKVNPKTESLPDKFVYIDLESVEAGNLLQKNFVSRSAAPSRAQRLLKNGDIIFQLVRPYQKNNYLFNEVDCPSYVASTGYAQLRANQSSTYLYQYVHAESFVEKVLSKSEGSNYPAISSGELSKILVWLPEPHEQQKIASCLSSLDKLIAVKSRKLDALGTHKKGLMQQLFPVTDDSTQ
ncbi:MAG: restriction endonuclease subunit S [Gammaproteobacteria bacterium]|nr:restriction endonuclease subunit S [Gammaproteobacteria bacterium]